MVSEGKKKDKIKIESNTKLVKASDLKDDRSQDSGSYSHLVVGNQTMYEENSKSILAFGRATEHHADFKNK